ncbi:uncharacterized protein [Eurosta solidaginis]|uniref:uncharacterized protein n=1 Tax=Eurosta solidaginis TaxID=178769 RepID=UPI0035308E6E
MDPGGVAHSLEGKQLTDDIKLKELAPFSKMLLSDGVRNGLQKTGFIYPTAIQATSIPMGKSGIDLLVQSKSGTGKTLIFCVIILEAYRSDLAEPQSLIVAPTREIAVQIEMVLNQIGGCCTGFRAVSVIGGLDVADDRKRLQGAKAIVGTPGRLLHLIQNNVLNTSKMRLLVLDEADKMYTQSFRQDLRRIQNALPEKRQTIACSATFCDGLDEELAKIMRNPLLISTEERATLLIGIKQFAYEIPEQKTSILEMRSKLEALRYIFGRIAFKQCLIFAGSQSRANSYCNYLEKEGWPCELISGAQDQKTRLERFHKFREFKTRIIITTDLMSRGVDSEHVNLVINLELPTDMVTYLHRIGRAGRFGSHGIAINFVASEKDRCTLTRLISRIGSGMNVLQFPPKNVAQTEDTEYDFWDFSNFDKHAKCFGLFGFEALAPLASQDHSLLSDTLENKENQSDNIFNSTSSIDTNTFRVDSKDSALNIQDNLLERPECQQQISPSHNLTVESRQGSSQQLPSSNTIDDASSIAADSLRSSQQDISRYQSILMQKAAIPTLFEFLVDPNSSDSKGDDTKDGEIKKKPKIDLFDDYKKAVLTNSDSSVKDTESKDIGVPATSNKIAAYKSMLIDQLERKSPVENKHDIYSDYANFNADENSSSLSQDTCSHEIDKATFILSVATPSKMQDSIEEYTNTTTTSDIQNLRYKTDSQDDVSEIKHFTSPAHHNQPNSMIPDVVPPSQRLLNVPYNAQQYHNLTVNVGAQIEIPPQQPHQALHSPNSPAMSDSVIHSPDDDQSATISAPASLNSQSNSERGGSSGFNERNTTSASSGIVTSDTEPDEYIENGYYTSSEENYTSSEEAGSGYSYEIDPALLFPMKKRRRRVIGSDYTEGEDEEEYEDENDGEDSDGEVEEDDKSENDEENDKSGEYEDVAHGQNDKGNDGVNDGNEADDDEEKTYNAQSGNENIHANGADELKDEAMMRKGIPETSEPKAQASVDFNNVNKTFGKKRDTHFTKRVKKSHSQRDAEAKCNADSSKYNAYYSGDYDAAHTRWMEIYWTQVKQIQDYVKMTLEARKRKEEKNEERKFDEEAIEKENIEEDNIDEDHIEDENVDEEHIDDENVNEEKVDENEK